MFITYAYKGEIAVKNGSLTIKHNVTDPGMAMPMFGSNYSDYKGLIFVEGSYWGGARKPNKTKIRHYREATNEPSDRSQDMRGVRASINWDMYT